MKDTFKKTIIWTNNEPPKNYLWAKDGIVYEYFGRWVKSKISTPDYISVKKIELNKNKLNLRIGRTANLAATVFPEDSTERTVTWISSNPEIAEVSCSGKVKGLSEGIAIIYSAIGGKTTSCKVTVS